MARPPRRSQTPGRPRTPARPRCPPSTATGPRHPRLVYAQCHSRRPNPRSPALPAHERPLGPRSPKSVEHRHNYRIRNYCHHPHCCRSRTRHHTAESPCRCRYVATNRRVDRRRNQGTEGGNPSQCIASPVPLRHSRRAIVARRSPRSGHGFRTQAFIPNRTGLVLPGPKVAATPPAQRPTLTSARKTGGLAAHHRHPSPASLRTDYERVLTLQSLRQRVREFRSGLGLVEEVRLARPERGRVECSTECVTFGDRACSSVASR